MLGTDLETGTSDEWIRNHVGILERRIASPFETHAYMAIKAIQNTLGKIVGLHEIVKPEEISIILTGNTHIPGLIPC
jgi:3-oxoacyl-[acyl-carrier-protein] synthase III